MKMKNTWMKLFSLILVLTFLIPFASFAEEAVQGDASDLLGTFMEYDSIPALFEAAEDALQEGADPAKVRDALYTAADQKEMYPYFTYALENYVSMGGKRYQALMNLLSPEESSDRELDSSWSYDRANVSGISFDAYSTSQASAAFRTMVNDTGAQYCIPAYFLTENDFKTLYNKEFSKFIPSRPRASYISIVIKNGAQSWPGKAWTGKEDREDFIEPFEKVFNALFNLFDSDSGTLPPVITGNPNLASAFLIYNYTFASDSHSYLINDSVKVRGYKTTISIVLRDASTRKDLAKYSETISINLKDDNMYYRWDNGIVIRTDLPDFEASSSFQSFAKRLASEIKKQDNLASASRPLTDSNAKAVLAGILEAQAKGADVWESAIYESGAGNISMNGSEISFTLQSFDPNLKKLGAYSKAKKPSEWMAAAIRNIKASSLKLTLKLSGGKPTSQSLNEMKQSVRKAANSAKKAFASSDMAAALKDYLFPAPLEGKVSKYTQLLSPSDSFKKLFSDRFPENEYLTATLFSIICYGQKSLTVNVKNGPHKLALTLTGIAKPDKTVASAADKVVENMAALPVEERTALSKPGNALLKVIAKTAYSAKEKFTLNMDAGQLSGDSMPGGYMNYLAKYDVRDALESMVERIKGLPDIAAVEMPGSKLLSGGRSGLKLTVKLPSEGKPTYIQVRKKDSRSIVATLFIHPGKSVSLKVPAGEYYLVYCSGTTWYGEKSFFNEPDKISVSDSFEMNKNYSMTITLKLISSGNMGVRSGSVSDLE